MPIVAMPDGTQVSFPDDMPAERIRGMILQKFPDAAQSGGARVNEVTVRPAGNTVSERFGQMQPPSGPSMSAGDAVMRGAVQGATFNYGDELAALQTAGRNLNAQDDGAPQVQQGPGGQVQQSAASGIDNLFRGISEYWRSNPQAMKDYADSILQERGKTKLTEADRPLETFAGNVAGGLATMAVAPGGAGLQGGNLAARALQGAKYGGAYGALAGSGDGEGAADTIGKTVMGGAVGAATGGALSAALGPRVAGNGQEVLEAAGRLGVEVPKGVASDSAAIQGLAQASRQLPYFGGRMENAIAATSEGLEGAVEAGVRQLGGGGTRDAVGAAARGAIDKAVEVAEQRADAAFSRLRNVIDPDATVPMNVRVVQTLDKIVNSRLAAGQSGIPLQGLENAAELLTRPQGASFNGLQRARSDIGKAIKWDQRNGGFMAGDLKQAYGALTDAIEDAVRETARISPDAATTLLRNANKTFGNVIGETKELSRILGKQGSDERIVDRIIGYGSDKAGRGDMAKLNLLRKSMPQDEWEQVSAFALQRMGLNQAGEFSTKFFVKNYETMTPAARTMMFGAEGTGTRQWIDDIAKVANRMNEAEGFRNTSNTGRATLTGLGLAGAGYTFADPMGAMENGLKTAAVAVPVVYFLAKPATAASMSRWSGAYENLVKRPTTATLASFNVASRNLANQMGEAVGIKIDPSVFLKSLQGPVGARAEEDQRPPGQ